MVQTEPRTRAQRIEAAVDHALHGRWELAATANRVLLDERPNDLEAANRLGKALTELGDLDAAADAYRRSLEIDRFNAIARKNLDRIEAAGASKGKAKARKAKATAVPTRARSTESLIEESGKSTSFRLIRPDRKELSRLEVGTTVELRSGPRGVTVHSERGTLLGGIEPHAGARLARLMGGGNRYQAVLRAISDDGALVHIRETYRHPSLLDQASFLAPAQERRKSAPRAYTRSSVVRRESGKDRDDEDEPDPWARSEDDDDLEGQGFRNSAAEDVDTDEDDDAVAADLADEDLGEEADGDEDGDDDLDEDDR